MPVPRAAIFVLTAAAIGGCSSGATAVRVPDGRVDVTLDDYLISPQKISVRPGRITFTATDRGRTTHTLRVAKGDRDLATITTLKPGQRGETTATLRKGTYKLYCAIANHEELGMWGTLVVR
jgi:plastocyanin